MNVMFISSVQQSNSVTHTHVSILFQILFPIWLLQNIKQSSLCYTVGISGVRTWEAVYKIQHTPML